MPLNVLETQGQEGIATVFIARTEGGRLIEFVESFQPGVPVEKKWVNVLSVMQGCPVRCRMCDAGGNFGGNLTREEIEAQIAYLVERRFPEGRISSEKWKVQFTRMGEPAYNPAVLEVLDGLPDQYHAPGLIPSVSTIAPKGREEFFERLREIKNRHYRQGRFQLQFSIHTTDPAKRDRLMPVKKWSFEKISEYGERFWENGDRKITLNFACMKDHPIEPAVVEEHFDPEKFLVKITPLNPTQKAEENGLVSALDMDTERPAEDLKEEFRRLGFDTIISIGALEENQVGSNCGQFVGAYARAQAGFGNRFQRKLK